MALLCAGIDTDLIRLVGRWRSDAMFRYLHAQATPIVKQLAKQMVSHGHFTLAPGAFEAERAKRFTSAVSDLDLKIQFTETAAPIDDDEDA